MPDTTARPLVLGRRDPSAHVETLASHGLISVALFGVEGRPATFVPFTPDEARRLGIALICAADQAEETYPPTKPIRGERRIVAVGRGDHVTWHDEALMA